MKPAKTGQAVNTSMKPAQTGQAVNTSMKLAQTGQAEKNAVVSKKSCNKDGHAADNGSQKEVS